MSAPLPVPVDQLNPDDALRTLIDAAARTRELQLERVALDQHADPESRSRALVADSLIHHLRGLVRELREDLGQRIATAGRQRETIIASLEVCLPRIRRAIGPHSPAQETDAMAACAILDGLVEAGRP